jgi:hypothetical protein
MSSFFDDASLVTIPSGYKDGKVYSVKPTSGNGDLTFTRNSNATRVDANGLVEKVRTNSLLQSNTLSTTWYNSGVTATGSQAGYDGTNDAWKLTRANAFNYFAQDITTSGVQTISIYAKADTYDWILLRFQRASTSYAGYYFDLANGIVGSADGSGVIDASVTSVGGGWHRISMTFNESLLRVLIYPVPSNGGVGVTGSGSVIVQDSQIEQGLVATDYIETTTTAMSEFAGVTASSVADVPRLDYSGGSCPSLLLESQRTNSMSYSEYIGTYFFYANASASNNQTTSPEGVVNSASIIPDATNGIHQIASSNISASGLFTLSAFVKAGELNKVAIRDSYATGAYASFDLSTGTKIEDNVSGDAFIEPFENDWYRIGVTYTHSGNIRLGINVLDNSYTSGNPSSGANYWSSNGTDKLYVYGMQCEAGSYPTSYIPTYGTTVTRLQEKIIQNIQAITSGWTEGTLFVEFVKPNTGENVDLMRWKGSGTLGRGFIYNTAAGFASDWGSSQQINIGGGDNNKVVWRLNSLSDGTDFINGTKGIGSSGTAWSDIRELRFNAEGAGGVLFIKQIVMFPTALTDEQCIELTTL